MIFDQTSRILPEDGDYVILNDNGSEGLSIDSQHFSLEDALSSLNTLSPQVIVKLVHFDIVENTGTQR